jgi:hypothetical protein
MTGALLGYRAVWDQKPVLRTVYNDMFDRIAAACVDGVTLELGGGVGNLKEKVTSLISSDIQFAPWLDLVADAQRLPSIPARYPTSSCLTCCIPGVSLAAVQGGCEGAAPRGGES